MPRPCNRALRLFSLPETRCRSKKPGNSNGRRCANRIRLRSCRIRCSRLATGRQSGKQAEAITTDSATQATNRALDPSAVRPALPRVSWRDSERPPAMRSFEISDRRWPAVSGTSACGPTFCRVYPARRSSRTCSSRTFSQSEASRRGRVLGAPLLAQSSQTGVNGLGRHVIAAMQTGFVSVSRRDAQTHAL